MAMRWFEVNVSQDSSASVIRVDAAGLSDSSTFLLTLHDVISQKTSGCDYCDIHLEAKCCRLRYLSYTLLVFETL
jgi:hypothetical protein